MTEPPRLEGLEGLAATFHDVGPRLAALVRDLCALRPDDRVLDVGCGIGRVALPLTELLDPDRGSYDGFDIVPEAVDWCRENVSSRHPNFRFTHAPIFNERYNPAGTVRDDEFVFPYDDDAFDVVVLTSVFTHMLPAGVDWYLGEIARVLRRDGRAFITMFLLNEESDGLRHTAGSVFSFSHDRGVYALQQADPPEAAVAFRESWVRQRFAAHGLELRVRYGSWCGRSEHLDLQDVILSTNS